MLINHTSPSFPEKIKNASTRVFFPKYSKHAVDASKSDRYGLINLPNRVEFNGKNIFEIELNNEKIEKYGIRISYNEKLDLILIANPDGFIRTVWFNDKTDTHKTLRKTS